MPRHSRPARNPRPHPPTSPQISYDAQTIIVVLLLLLFYPVGIVFMWLWMKWPVYVKLIIMLPVFFFLIMVGLFIFIFSAVVHSDNYNSRFYRWRYERTIPSSPMRMMYITPASNAADATPTPSSGY